MGKCAKVVVAMSGGVDSSVSAALLKEQGFDVIGVFMNNWKDFDGTCPAVEEYEDVIRVCHTIGIPYYTVNFVREYWENVFAHFLRELQMGYTPNPDILCNREIKFKALFQKAMDLGADYLATGHYAQIRKGSLIRGIDPEKDQTYFLYSIQSKLFEKVLFPVGHLTKREVRALARHYGLPTAEKKESMGLCFVGKRDFREFLQPYLPYREGDFETVDGRKMGKHQGVAFYTVGQRKGLGIGGAGEAWFVVGKNVEQNIVYVSQGRDSPSLYQSSLVAAEANWISGTPPATPFRCEAQIRYRQTPNTCTIEQMEDSKLRVFFEQPQRAVTPRQSIVFYQGATCLGGAFIEK